MSMEKRRNVNERARPKYSRQTCPTAICPQQISARLKTGPRIYRMAINSLSNGTIPENIVTYWTKVSSWTKNLDLQRWKLTAD